VGGEFPHAVRSQANPIFMNLDLFGNADTHCQILLRRVGIAG
jgi:hypothetical protein